MTSTAEPLLLVPGMMGDARHFSPQIAAFSSQRPVHIAPITGAETVEDAADQVLAHAPPRFALAGLALGGIVAMEIMRRDPERATRLALIATNPLSETPGIAATREPRMARARAGKIEEVIREEFQPDYFAPGPGRVAALNTLLEMARTVGPEVFIRQSRMLQRRPDQQRTLRGVRVPTLVLGGRHDTLCPVRRHELMAELIPGATLEIIEEAGHLPTLEAPDATTAALSRWLTGTLLLK